MKSLNYGSAKTKGWQKVRVWTATLVFCSILSSSCHALRLDGPYEGRVVEASTGLPIQGAVVLSEWVSVTVTPGGRTSHHYDVQETTTDRNGEFRIKGQGLLVLSRGPDEKLTEEQIGKAGMSLHARKSLELPFSRDPRALWTFRKEA